MAKSAEGPVTMSRLVKMIERTQELIGPMIAQEPPIRKPAFE